MEDKKPTTKRLLVAYDPSSPDTASSDFLVPVHDSMGLFLLGLKSKKVREQGIVVYIGKAITVNDLFARLVDSGRKIESVAETLAVLEAYLHMLQDYRIDNILAVEPASDRPGGYQLKKLADRRPVKKANLP